MVQPYAGRNVGGIPILRLETFFHSGQVNQIEHLAPVHLLIFPDHIYRILNGMLYELHLLDPVLYELLLHFQRSKHKMIVRVIDRHLPDIVERESQIFEQKDLLQSCKI